jgi:hypothetical protein
MHSALENSLKTGYRSFLPKAGFVPVSRDFENHRDAAQKLCVDLLPFGTNGRSACIAR